ncbi:alpha/beta fold hydrolase [Conexibacter sp. DBS9H8]|uniref:alpha/beta fold hydrolase n=1 Tax=Conexibacter sp. DBS9H8 TaxID=2937801 RepID=UPI00200E90D0|nr:alpha/beta fold hydrolase [Conexibacter sp. DBS9H8]
MSTDTADVDRFSATPDGLRICFRTDGDPGNEPILLIAGLGQQLISWPADFVDGLVDADFFVIRHDNRDIGRSDRVRLRPPVLWRQILRRFPAAQYTLADMAADSVAVLDALEVPRAHVVGMSMGGMIAQTIAARYPDRTATLTSIFSNTGHLHNGWVHPRALLAVASPPAREREANASAFVAMMAIIGSAGFPLDREELRALALDAYDRGDGANAHHGTARQIGAIYKSGDRTAELAEIAAPTLVIHGDRDRMVHPSGGRATARAIPGARLVTIPGMGHELPRRARPRLIELISDHVHQSPADPAARR